MSGIVAWNVGGAGFEVREFGRPAESGRDIGVVIDGQVRSFYITEAVRNLLGAQGKTYYHDWSGTTHHAPWALMPWTTIRRNDNDTGLHL